MGASLRNRQGSDRLFHYESVPRKRRGLYTNRLRPVQTFFEAEMLRLVFEHCFTRCYNPCVPGNQADR